jgi:hypothetical protein
MKIESYPHLIHILWIYLCKVERMLICISFEFMAGKCPDLLDAAKIIIYNQNVVLGKCTRLILIMFTL